MRAKDSRPGDNGGKSQRKIFRKENLKHNTVVSSIGFALGIVVFIVFFAGIFDKDVKFTPTGGLTISSSVVSEIDTTKNGLEELIRINIASINANAEAIKKNHEAIEDFKSMENQRHFYLDREVNIKFDHIKQTLDKIERKIP